MRLLAFDTGIKTGWASNENGVVESGVQTFELKRGESPGIRFLWFRKWLEQMFDLVKPELVLYEQAHHRGGFATQMAVGMTTRIMETCALRGVEYKAVHSASLKKWATGNGRASKEMMIEKARILMGRDPQDDNEADSYLLLRMGEAMFFRKELDEEINDAD